MRPSGAQARVGETPSSYQATPLNQVSPGGTLTSGRPRRKPSMHLQSHLRGSPPSASDGDPRRINTHASVYLGRKRLREISRETIDTYAARLSVDGAGAPTINRTLGVLQGVFHRALEWRRLGWNPVVGVRRFAHTRAETIDARTPETVEAIRRQLDP